MTRHTDPAYRFDTPTGQLFFSSGRTEIIVGDIDLALVWTTDEDGNGCMHNHGSKRNAEAKAAAIRMIDDSTKTVVIPWEAISHPEAGPKIIEEVNKCLAISGRIARIEEFLGSVAAGHEIEIFPRDGQDTTPEMAP